LASIFIFILVFCIVFVGIELLYCQLIDLEQNNF